MSSEKQLIDVDAFIEHWNKEYRHQYANDMFKIALANFPTVDAVEVVHGRWLDGKLNYITLNRGNHICSNCRSATGVVKFNYCPNCGAKMDGGENNE